jgi:hypothetical protein
MHHGGPYKYISIALKRQAYVHFMDLLNKNEKMKLKSECEYITIYCKSTKGKVYKICTKSGGITLWLPERNLCCMAFFWKFW